jgi:hypothetical protein
LRMSSRGTVIGINAVSCGLVLMIRSGSITVALQIQRLV